MKILLHEDVQLEFSDIANRTPLDLSTPRPPRKPGIHLSGVLKGYALAKEILTPIEIEEGSESVYPLRMACGLMWEEFCASLYPDMDPWPGQWERDGVIGNPDGRRLIASGEYRRDFQLDYAVTEFKFTHKSCSNDRAVPNMSTRVGVVDWWMWLNQVQGYCNMHPDEPCDLAEFHVLYANGDYQHPYRERYIRTLIEFSPIELEQNWEMIKKSKRLAKAEV